MGLGHPNAVGREQGFHPRGLPALAPDAEERGLGAVLVVIGHDPMRAKRSVPAAGRAGCHSRRQMDGDGVQARRPWADWP